MKVQTVTVKTHEKRAHPSAMGHYDAEVGYTAELEDGEDVTSAVELLQCQARQHVAIECDRWEAGVKLEEKRSSARSTIDWIIERADHSNVERSGELEKFNRELAVLPVDEHAKWNARLEAARAEYKQYIEKALDELISKAARRELKYFETGQFDGLLADVPDDERQLWQDKMAAAVAEYEAAQMGKEEPVNNG